LNPRFNSQVSGGDSLFIIMAEGKNKIIVYADWIEIFEPLSDDEAGKLVKHFFRYVNDLNPTSPDRLTTLLFDGSIKPTLKRDLRRWEEIAGKRSEAGKISAEKRKQQEPTKSTSVESVEQTPTKSTVKDKANVTVTVKDNEIVNEILLKKEPKKTAEIGEIDLNPFSENFRPVWNSWTDYKKNELKKSFKLLRTQQAAFRHLFELSKSNEITAQKIIEQSIANQWTGLFELKNGNNGTGEKQTRIENFEQGFREQFAGKDLSANDGF
jgi:hypothetical protein